MSAEESKCKKCGSDRGACYGCRRCLNCGEREEGAPELGHDCPICDYESKGYPKGHRRVGFPGGTHSYYIQDLGGTQSYYTQDISCPPVRPITVQTKPTTGQCGHKWVFAGIHAFGMPIKLNYKCDLCGEYQVIDAGAVANLLPISDAEIATLL